MEIYEVISVTGTREQGEEREYTPFVSFDHAAPESKRGDGVDAGYYTTRKVVSTIER